MSAGGTRSRSGGPNLLDVIKQFEDAYGRAEADLGKFNLAIFGKTGVGKSTLINAVFGAEVAKTGAGRPVTLKTEYYEHPSGYLGIYDSQGIEVGEEGDEILAKLRGIISAQQMGPIEDQIHVIWYCVRSTDLRFEDKQAEFIQELAKERLPIIFVLTQVQRRNGGIHPEVEKLVVSVIDRKLPLAPDNRVFLTMALPDEWAGWLAHGVQDLLDATFRVAPRGVEEALTAAQRIDTDRKARQARTYLAGAAASSAAAGAVPIPFADAALLVPIQVGLMAKIAAIFGLGLKKGTLATIAGAALTGGGITQTGKYLVTNLLKFVPGGNVAAGTIRAGVASSLTYAVGEAWITVCGQLYRLGAARVEQMPTDEIRDLFTQEFKARATKTGST